MTGPPDRERRASVQRHAAFPSSSTATAGHDGKCAAAALLNGTAPRPQAAFFTASNWRAHASGTMVAWIDLQVGSLKLHDCIYHERDDGARWVALPNKRNVNTRTGEVMPHREGREDLLFRSCHGR